MHGGTAGLLSDGVSQKPGPTRVLSARSLSSGRRRARILRPHNSTAQRDEVVWRNIGAIDLLVPAYVAAAVGIVSVPVHLNSYRELGISAASAPEACRAGR